MRRWDAHLTMRQTGRGKGARDIAAYVSITDIFDEKEEKMQQKSEKPTQHTNGINDLTPHRNLLCISGMWTQVRSYPCTIIETAVNKQNIIHFFLLSLPLLFLLFIAFVIVPHAPTAPRRLSSYYTYGDNSSFLLSQLSQGGTITIIWRAFPDTSSPSAHRPTAITLRVLLVHEIDFQHGVCGAYPKPIILDVLKTSNVSSWPYSRTIQLPLQIRPGRYELVRQAQEARISFCVSSPLLISNAAPMNPRLGNAGKREGFSLCSRLS